MVGGRYVAYFRVSTDKQGRSGLGLEAQQRTVRDRLNGGAWTICGEFTEVESGRVSQRPQLEQALTHCQLMGAKLIVANVSRLTRDPDFMGRLVKADVEVEFCDLPNVEGAVGRFMLRQMLAVAELEAGMVSERTKRALAAKKAWYASLSEEDRERLKAKGKATKLGGDPRSLIGAGERGRDRSKQVRQQKADGRASAVMTCIRQVQEAGAVSLREIAKALNDRDVPTVRGGKWSAVQVSRVMSRAET